jgi:hypothetical protein
MAGFLVVAVLWLCIVYLPGRTMEYSETRQLERREGDGGASGTSG